MNYKVVISRREHGPPLSIIFVARQNNRNFNKGTELDILLVFWLLVAPNTNHYVATRDWGRLKQHQHHSMQSTTHPYSKMFNILGAQHYHCVPHKTATCRVQNVLMSHIYKEQNHPMPDTESHIQPACLRTNHMLRLSTTMFMYHVLTIHYVPYASQVPQPD